MAFMFAEPPSGGFPERLLFMFLEIAHVEVRVLGSKVGRHEAARAEAEEQLRAVDIPLGESHDALNNKRSELARVVGGEIR